MPRNAMLEVKGGDITGTVRGFLEKLLEKKAVDALLVPVEVPSKKNVVQTMVTDIAQLADVSPLAPVMPVNTAKIISSVTKVAASTKKVGVILRSCELRALVEMVKLKQADMNNIVTIGIDCFGTYSVTDYAVFSQEHDTPAGEYLKKAASGTDTLLRPACKICQYPYPLTADMTIGLFGLPIEKEILVHSGTKEGDQVFEALGLDGEADPAKRDEALSALKSERQKLKEEFLAQVQQEAGGLDNMLSVLSACVACHNCRIACPICYCRECLLDSPTFVEWEAEKYLDWASRKGALRLPADSLLFHLVRMNHMGASCVACGLCEDACPNSIAVYKLFCLAGSRVQETFEYTPGRSADDELPLTAFKEEEFKGFEK